MIEQTAAFNRERVLGRRPHAKGSGALAAASADDGDAAKFLQEVLHDGFTDDPVKVPSRGARRCNEARARGTKAQQTA
jgi:hypothetical protein